MYEFALTNSVNNAVQKLCFDAGWSKIHRVMVKVGGMRKVNPELMSFIFSALAKDTPAEGAILSVMVMPATFYCYACGRRGYREDSEFQCPSCGSRNVQLLSGLELSLEVLEVEGNLFNHE